MFRVRPRALLPIAAALALAAPIRMPGAAGDTPDLQSTFEAKYRAWLQQRRAAPSLSSEFDARRVYDNEPFRAVVRLGPAAVPYMIKKVQQDRMLGYALYRITGFTWHWHLIKKDAPPEVWVVDEFPGERWVGHPPDARLLWLRWWQERGKRTPVWFHQRYREWQRLEREGKQDEANQQYQLIVELGLEALPLMVDTMKKGSSDLVPALSRLTNRAVKEDAKPAECVQWWNDNKDKWTLPPPESKEESDTKSQGTAR